MRTWGEPGGVYLRMELDFARNDYVLYNEDGEEIFADSFESVVVARAEEIIWMEANR